MEWQVIADMAIGASVPLAAAALYAAKRISLREILFLIIGISIGLIFESHIGIQGASFIIFKMKWPLPQFTIFISHSLWDGGIFMIGYFLAALITRKPRSQICAKFRLSELAVMIAWGAVSSFFVELTGNGVLWEYQPQKFNPSWITINGQTYTVFIQIVWLVAPIVFYFSCIAVTKLLNRANNQ